MLFSRVSAGSRLKNMGLIRGRDENQLQIRGRLDYFVAQSPPGTPQHEDGTGQPGLNTAVEGEQDPSSPLQDTKKRVRKKKIPMKGDKIHPLWYKGADPSWFEAVHVDATGRPWCMADAAQIMQAGARGFLYRKSVKLRKQKALQSFQMVYVVKIQRWWRIVSTRSVRHEQIELREGAARATLQRWARSAIDRETVRLELRKEIDSALRVQRKFRSTRMKRVMHLLKEKQLETACLMVQRRWRDRQRWLNLLQDEQNVVMYEAKVVKRNFLKGMMQAGKAHAAQPSVEGGAPALKRIGSLVRFMQNTGVLGRQIVFKKHKQENLGDESAEFMLKEAMRVTRDQVLALNAKKRDSHEIMLKLEEARSHNKALLDLSGFGERLFRWPYGLQGNHGLFAIKSLHINDNAIKGLPLDFYGLTNLTDLRAHNNKIVKIQPEINRLSKLMMMWFHNNSLEIIPATVGELTELIQLSIDHNKLDTIPTTIGFLTKLRELRLEGNPLISPPRDIVRKIQRPPFPWDISVCMRYLRQLHTHQEPGSNHVYMPGVGLLKMPAVLGTMLHLRDLDFRNNRIEELPKLLFTLTKLSRLILSENRIERVPALIRHLSWLQELSLARNRITQAGLPAPSLATLTSLQKLFMTENHFDSPPVQVLTQSGPVIVRYLQQVQLAANGSDTLSLASFRLRSLPRCDVFPSVRKLDLRDNMLRSLPPSVLSIPRLSELLLASNLMETLPSQIHKLRYLRALDVSANSLTGLPDELALLSDLTTLDLSHNSIVEVQESLRQLSSLRTLNASHNSIQALPHDLSQLCLWDLDLSYNALRALPDSFHSMTELHRLVIDGNRIRDLPPSLAQCCLNITFFSASKNALATIPPAIGRLALLHTLKLPDNSIRILPRSMRAMVSLTSIDLERNELEAVPAGVCTLPAVSTLKFKSNFLRALPAELCTLSTLTVLDACNNNLQTLPVELHELTSLTTLLLASNQLRVLPPTPPHVGPVFARMESLETLDLRDNSLKRLPLDLAQAPRLRSLLLHNNPWTDNPRLKRVVAPRPEDYGGELLLFVVNAEGLAKMDGRKGLSDPYAKITLQDQKFKTNVVNGSLNPVWEQRFSLELDDDPSDDAVEVEVFDWDLSGSDDFMGSFQISLTPALLTACRHRKAPPAPEAEGSAGESSGQVERVYELTGTDELGRPAQGRVRVQLEFYPLDGSLTSVQRYLERLRVEGWGQIREETIRKQEKRRAGKVRATPDGMLFEDEKDEIRHRCELKDADAISRQTRDWLWQVGQQREPWQNLHVMYTPQGMSNSPWDLAKTRFSHQTEEMTHFLKLKAHSDALDPRKRNQKGAVDKDRWDRRSLLEVKEELQTLVRDDLEDPEYDREI